MQTNLTLNFFELLETYVQVRPTEAMKNLIVEIIAEILDFLAIATKEIRQGWRCELVSRRSCHLTLAYRSYLKKLFERTDMY
jgi:hypothetical protein